MTEIPVAKVNEELGIVIGWASVAKIDGQLLKDSQGDTIEPTAYLEASIGFEGVAKDTHKTECGRVVAQFPIIEEVTKALGLQSNIEGLAVIMKPDAGVLAKFKSGEYTGFSIGGMATELG